ncbi:response regulator transcription factor LtdR [Marivirga atlantica]|jgi:DNA-binding LytR/AlgR family response regulator|uniref:Response regulator transcription factor n=1 Tax=Marivirga atlantica TaxID=1548457 RepID=A0A937ABX2_9BACT|nr:response regulator transcription factor [Marivirga atlantica]MBL0766005.1 response regulator transcription factor [Marivirga atlantica]
MDIKVLIIEDNPITGQDLKEILEDYGMLVTGVTKTRSEVLMSINGQSPDVLLVDINLKHNDDGIEIVDELLKTYHFPFIYLTANSDVETVKRAFKTNPASYLTKPYDDKDVIIALELAFNNHYSKVIQEGVKNNPFIYLKGTNDFEKVHVDDVLFLQAQGSYTVFFTSNKTYTLTSNLTHSKEKIEHPSFLRIHRSYVVNTKHISAVKNDSLLIANQTLPIGRSYKNDIKHKLQKIS